MERFRHDVHMGTKPFQHGLDHMVVQHKYAMFLDLGRKMPVTDMPAEFGKMDGIGRKHFEQLFFTGYHFDEPAIIQLQRIAMIQRNRRLKIDENLITMFQPQHLAAHVALVMGKHDNVPGRA